MTEKLTDRWESYRRRRLQGVSLQELVESHERAFYAGAWAAVAELVIVPPGYATAMENRDATIDALCEELTKSGKVAPV